MITGLTRLKDGDSLDAFWSSVKLNSLVAVNTAADGIRATCRSNRCGMYPPCGPQTFANINDLATKTEGSRAGHSDCSLVKAAVDTETGMVS